MTIPASDMADKLLTIDAVLARLEPTEHLAQVPFDDHPVALELPAGWNVGLKERSGTEVTQAVVTVDGTESVLTKDAALELTSAFGLTKDYVSKTPGPLVAAHVNWWLGNSDKELKMLRAPNDVGLAFTKATLNPFSNVRLVEEALSSLRGKYGEGVQVLADYKMAHDLRRTSIRLIVPEHVRTMDSQRNTADSPDQWSTGVHIFNSIVGEKPMNLSGYLFAWYCTNGAISVHASSGNYNRRSQGQGEEAYEWARLAVDDILGGLEHELDAVADTLAVDLADEIGHTVMDLFEQYRVPLKLRESIMTAVGMGDDTSAYALLNAVTQAANDPEVPDTAVTTLMQIGGDLPSAFGKRCTHCARLKVGM